MKLIKNQDGFSYIETIISLMVITIGLLGAISALTWGFQYVNEAEKRTRAKEIVNSTIESIFAVRDINATTATSGIKIQGWDLIQNKTSSNTGIFSTGSFPVRSAPGADGIYGTTDDSCAAGSSCNSNPEIPGYTRIITITDIVENNVVRKRNLTVAVTYSAGLAQRQVSVSTIIANLPFSAN